MFFPGLLRGEFHFAPTDEIGQVGEWPARGAPVDRMVVLDRTGALRKALVRVPEQPVLPDFAEVCGRFANWLVLAHHVACRGEALRAADALGHVQRHLLWMARLVEDSTEHWLTPSRLAEREIVTPIDATSPSTAWRCGRALWLELAVRHGKPVPHSLFDELDAVLAR